MLKVFKDKAMRRIRYKDLKCVIVVVVFIVVVVVFVFVVVVVVVIGGGGGGVTMELPRVVSK